MKNLILDKTESMFFHVTPIENLESILQNGLLPMIGKRSNI